MSDSSLDDGEYMGYYMCCLYFFINMSGQYNQILELDLVPYTLHIIVECCSCHISFCSPLKSQQSKSKLKSFTQTLVSGWDLYSADDRRADRKCLSGTLSLSQRNAKGKWLRVRFCKYVKFVTIREKLSLLTDMCHDKNWLSVFFK